MNARASCLQLALALAAGSAMLFDSPQSRADPVLTVPAAQTDKASRKRERYVRGPNGQRLVAFKQAAAGTHIRFTQIAHSITKGQVIGSDASFDISRLPATFMATIGDEVCTATLVGPQVLLTAAHCVDAGAFVNGHWQTLKGSVALADGSSQQDIYDCTMAPAYVAGKHRKNTVRNDNDFALCELYLPMNVRAEPIAREPAWIGANQSLLIAGYGCTEDELIGNRITADTPASGTLHVGTNHILGGGPDGWVSFRGTPGSPDAILCPGDSGGGAYAGADIDPQNSDFGWRVVAVNSSVGPADAKGVYVSYLAPLADPDFQALLDLFWTLRRTERRICGPDSAALGPKCRQ